ncbi:MAG: hypothetical protein ACR2PS_14170 [Pseudomonadales bacterium]
MVYVIRAALLAMAIVAIQAGLRPNKPMSQESTQPGRHLELASLAAMPATSSRRGQQGLKQWQQQYVPIPQHLIEVTGG